MKPNRLIALATVCLSLTSRVAWAAPGTTNAKPAPKEDLAAATWNNAYPPDVIAALKSKDFQKAAALLETNLDAVLAKASSKRLQLLNLHLLSDLYRSPLGQPEKAKPILIRMEKIYAELLDKAKERSWDWKVDEKGFPKDHRLFRTMSKFNFDGATTPEIVRDWANSASFLSMYRVKKAMLDFLLADEYGEESYRDKAEDLIWEDSPDDFGIVPHLANWRAIRWKNSNKPKESGGVQISVEAKRGTYFNAKEGLPVPIGMFRNMLPVKVTLKNNSSKPLKVSKNDFIFKTPLTDLGPIPPTPLDRLVQIAESKDEFETLKAAWYFHTNPQLAPYQNGGFLEQDLAKLFAVNDKMMDENFEKYIDQESEKKWAEIRQNLANALERDAANREASLARSSAVFEAGVAKMQASSEAFQKESRGDMRGASLARAEGQAKYNSIMSSGNAQAAEASNRAANVGKGAQSASDTGGEVKEISSAVLPVQDTATILNAISTENENIFASAALLWKEFMPACNVMPPEMILKPGESWTGFAFFDLGRKMHLGGSKSFDGTLTVQLSGEKFEFDFDAKRAGDFAPPWLTWYIAPNGIRRITPETFQSILKRENF